MIGLDLLQIVFNAVAVAFAVAVPCWKVHETSYAFREAEDPSQYDDWKAWFEEVNPPLADQLGGAKQALRVYTFILPFIGSLFFALLASLLGHYRMSRDHSTGQCKAAMPGAEGWRAVCVMLAKQVHFPEWTQRFLLFPAALTRGEILGATLFVALNLLVIPFRVHRSLGRGAKKLTFLRVKGSEEPIPAISFQAVEVWANTFGVVSIMNLGWYLMMPIGRKSVLLEMFGVSWEYAIKWHRMISAYTIGLMLAHSVLYFIVWIHGDGHPDYDPEGKMVEHNLLRCDSSCDEDQELMFRQNMYGLVTLACIIVIAVTSMSCVRRRHFELFYYAHHLFLVLLVFTCLHYDQAIIYLIPGLGIYGVDKVCRVLACRGGVWAEVELVTDDVVELRVPLDSRASYKAGQYIFLNVPEISVLQWHPFSLTSAPEESKHNGRKIVFHVKAMGGEGSGTWTASLLAAVQNSPTRTLWVKVDGFFAHAAAEDLSKTGKAALLIGGGVGITPLLSITAGICAARTTVPVVLVWNTRSHQEFLAFAPRIQAIKARYGDQVLIYAAITKKSEGPHDRGPLYVTAKSLHSTRRLSAPAVAAATPGAKKVTDMDKSEDGGYIGVGGGYDADEDDGSKDDASKDDANTPAAFVQAETIGSPAQLDQINKGKGGGFVPVVPSKPWYAFACVVTMLSMTWAYAQVRSQCDTKPCAGGPDEDTYEDTVRIAGLAATMAAAVVVVGVLLIAAAVLRAMRATEESATRGPNSEASQDPETAMEMPLDAEHYRINDAPDDLAEPFGPTTAETLAQNGGEQLQERLSDFITLETDVDALALGETDVDAPARINDAPDDLAEPFGPTTAEMSAQNGGEQLQGRLSDFITLEADVDAPALGETDVDAPAPGLGSRSLSYYAATGVAARVDSETDDDTATAAVIRTAEPTRTGTTRDPITRRDRLTESMLDLLRGPPRKGIQVRKSIWYTQKRSSRGDLADNSERGPPQIGRRLDLGAAFDAADSFAADADEISVIACGAASMVQEARRQCEKRNGSELGDPHWQFKEECWEW